jgi:hypothetical protein
MSEDDEEMPGMFLAAFLFALMAAILLVSCWIDKAYSFSS